MHLGVVLGRVAHDTDQEADSLDGMIEDTFGRLCVERGYATAEQVQEAIEVKQKLEDMDLDEKLGVIMVRKGYVTEDQVREILRLQG